LLKSGWRWKVDCEVSHMFLQRASEVM
jgi:hypothetical protein